MAGQTRGNAGNETPRIKQVLRPEVPLRPTEPRLKFDAKEIADFPINAVAHTALQFALWIADLQSCLKRNGEIDLDAGAGK
jgi:hypothetical protein